MESDIVENILKERYYQPGETCWEDIAKRVSNFIGSDETERADFYKIINDKLFIPNSPCLMNAGTKTPMLFACFVLDVPDDMKGIGNTLTDAMCIQAKGGGTGFYFGNLRAKGSLVKSTNGIASGPVSFLKAYDAMTNVILQGGRRRGANMGSLPVWHKDIKEFITCKSIEGSISNFNLSVLINDEFMNNPDPEIFDLIVNGMWQNGEPGLQFFENINRNNPTPKMGPLYGSNPCLHADTLIFTDNGIERISETMSNSIWNGEEYSLFTKWSNGIKDVVTITTNSGFEYIVTPDHKFMLEDGSWCEAKDLIGKNIKFDLSGNQNWEGDIKHSCNFEVLGFEFGDGNYHKASSRMKYIYFTPEKDQEVADIISKEFNDVPEFDSTGKRYFIKIPYGTVYAGAFSGILPERMIPDWIMQLPKNEMKLFIRGLFSANGCNLKKYNKIQLVSSNKEMLKQVQMMLLAFGIKGKLWWHNKSCMNTFSNGNYVSKQSWHLVLSCSSYTKYLDEIGFIQSYKNGYNHNINFKLENELEKVIDVSPCGQSEVWDFNEPINNYASIGAIVHNCSETFLYPNESCVLGSIDVSKFATVTGDIDYMHLERVINLGVAFLDNCVDVNLYPTKAIEDATKLTRKIGLGIMGFADLLISLGIVYGSPKCIEFIDSFMSWFNEAAINASHKIACQKEEYPVNKDSTWAPLPMRNAVVTLLAPTGTIALFAGCSSGIEPNFAYAYKRSTWVDGEKKTYTMLHPMFKKLVLDKYQRRSDAIRDHMLREGTISNCSYINEDLKKIFVTAKDVTWKQHVDVLATFQKYIHNSISKTINCPESITKEEVAELVKYAWTSGCKGLTIYREGSRKDVVLETNATKKDESKIVEITNPVQYKLATANGRILPKTPRDMPATVHKRTTACGKLYVIPAEAFDQLHSLFLVNKGGCDAMTQVIAELIGSMCRFGIPRWEITRICSGIVCPACRNKRKLVDGNSCADIIARVILENYPVDEEPPKCSEEPTEDTTEIITINKVPCPKCGEALIMQEGCRTCPSCGYSKCS